MRTIQSLFSRSPFSLLQNHMEKVKDCVHLLKDLFKANLAGKTDEVDAIQAEISKREHFADEEKNKIRNNLPNSIFMPIKQSSLLEILSIQDSIADIAEDIAVLTTLKKFKIPSSLQKEFQTFLDKNILSFDKAHNIIKELHTLCEYSFGGKEAQKVRTMVHDVAFLEHEIDLLQRNLLKGLFKEEENISYGTFYCLQNIFQTIGAISNLSEKLGNRIRMTLEVK